MLEWIGDLIGLGGLWGVAALMAIENVFLPLPSELIMPLAGYAASRGRMTLINVVLFGTIGSVVGALPLYYGARVLGRENVKRWIERHGRWLMVSKRDLDRASDRFEKRGLLAVFLGQLLPGVRGLISIPAGFTRMNVLVFIAANFLGTILWCGVLAYLGAILGPSFPAVDKLLGPAGWIIVVSLIAGGTIWLVRRRKSF
jgi:membrane protein DedA with SNARE-associated domain